MLLLLVTINMHGQKYNTWRIHMCEGVCMYTCTCKNVPKILIALFDYEML